MVKEQYIYPNNKKYEGDFKDDRVEGNGKFYAEMVILILVNLKMV